MEHAELAMAKCNGERISQSKVSKQPNEHAFIKIAKTIHEVQKPKPRAKEQTTRRWKSKEYGIVNKQKNPKRRSAKENTTTRSICQSSIKASSNQANYIEVKEDVVKEEKLF